MTILANQRSQFKSIKDLDFLNESINYHMETLKRFTDQKKIMELLQRMSEYSVKTLGVSFMSNKEMAKKIKVHTRTIQRYTATLERLGIISKVKTLREKGRGQTSNTYVILPVIARGCRGVCRPLKPSLKPSSFKQDDIKLENDKLLQLFNWKLKDKTVQYGSSYVEKVVNTLFNYAQTLIDHENRREQMESILASHGVANEKPDYVPSFDWLEKEKEKTIPKHLEWLIK